MVVACPSFSISTVNFTVEISELIWQGNDLVELRFVSKIVKTSSTYLMHTQGEVLQGVAKKRLMKRSTMKRDRVHLLLFVKRTINMVHAN